MKKIMALCASAALTFTPLSLVIACDIGSIDGHDYLNGLPNFDWANSDYGDGIDFNNSNSANVLVNSGQVTNLGRISATNSGHYLNYDQFNTGFQWEQNIKKQAVTGIPLNKGFMPNGNYAADFGITSSARRYLRLNSILDWNANKDHDAKYNQSLVALQPRKLVATNNGNQDERLGYNQLGFSTRKHRTFDNTIVGTKNPFENTMLNWQYTNAFINWSGSWFEGPIIPPPADVTDMAHRNGTPIYGNVFLDGYHGLTKEMLKDFLAQNNDGTYKIVNILINIAKYCRFDGWFINNEANGAAPNGTILDYNVMADIMKQFNTKVATSSDKDIQQLKLIFYHDGGSVAKIAGYYDDQEMLLMSKTGYQRSDGTITPTDLQLNFDVRPADTVDFLKDFTNYQPHNLNTMIDEGANPHYFGSYDFRQLAYKYSIGATGPIYDKNIYTSFSTYLDSGAGTFGNYAFDWARNNGVDNTRAYLFATQTTNLFNNIQFAGTNCFISNDDKGLNKNDYAKMSLKTSFQEAAFNADPRIIDTNKGAINDFVRANIYNYQDKGRGYNSSSYGIGSLVPPTTTLVDGDGQALNATTNFSMGSGIKFVNRDGNGNVITAGDYPWTNRRLSDILPTYLSQIYAKDNPDTPLPINEIGGFYDYDQVYQKGNSIAIGKGFNKEGSVESAVWQPGKTYDWDIMGANLTNNNHKISFIYNDNNNGQNVGDDVSILVTTVSAGQTPERKVLPLMQKPTPLSDGWVKITADLSKWENTLNDNNRIAKIGLQFTPKVENFKFNVGEFAINEPNADASLSNENDVISDVNSEYVIDRLVNKEHLFNVRLQWNAINNSNINYYAIYYFDKDKWYRIGETTQTCYFIKNLAAVNGGMRLMIKPVVNNILSSSSFEFTIER